MRIDKESLRQLAGKVADKTAETFNKTAETIENAVSIVSDSSKKAVDTTKEFTKEKQQEVFNKLDQNANGKIDLEDILIMGMKVPGVRVDREQFLKKELELRCTSEEIESAIASRPSLTDISKETIDGCADSVIQFERNCVSGMSAALGIPGGFALAATVPSDIAQYYGFLLRASQKLMYLYGFPQIAIDENGTISDPTSKYILTLCMGVMFDVDGASDGLQLLAQKLASGADTEQLQEEMETGALKDALQKIENWFNAQLGKELFAGVIKKSIPLFGAAIGGGSTYITFKPYCIRLKSCLQQTALTDSLTDSDASADETPAEAAEAAAETPDEAPAETTETAEDTVETPDEAPAETTETAEDAVETPDEITETAEDNQ